MVFASNLVCCEYSFVFLSPVGCRVLVLTVGCICQLAVFCCQVLTVYCGVFVVCCWFLVVGYRLSGGVGCWLSVSTFFHCRRHCPDLHPTVTLSKNSAMVECQTGDLRDDDWLSANTNVYFHRWNYTVKRLATSLLGTGKSLTFFTVWSYSLQLRSFHHQQNNPPARPPLSRQAGQESASETVNVIYLKSGWDLAETCLTANAHLATVLGSSPVSTDTAESEGRQCWITYFKKSN
jgi:hypothetical protein